SSRRRHTRSTRDWSSDVCSSDLFTFLPKATAVDMMTRQLRRMGAAGDLAVSQAEELKDALDDLTSNRFVVGDHHFTLHVLADAFDGSAHDTAAPLKALNDHIAKARFLL